MLLRTDMATKAETNKSRFVSLIDYVCINPLHDEDETHERMFLAWATSTRPRHTTKEQARRTVSLVDYVCSNPLHEESETHERMFLRTDMGRSRPCPNLESLGIFCACAVVQLGISAVICCCALAILCGRKRFEVFHMCTCASHESYAREP